MRKYEYAVSILILIFAAIFVPILSAQSATPAVPKAQASAQSSKIPDLSGDWTADPKRGGIGQSLSMADTGGKNKGNEGDIPYQPWALAKTMSEVSSTAPGGNYEKTTDPQVKFCDPPGPAKIYMWPAKTYVVQTPNVVYLLYEFGPYWRPVWMNRNHPDDPDPTWWGDSVGHYENGDTLVVDTVGFNGKIWLDQMGHPTTEKLHLIERYKRVDKNTMELDMTIDDPGAYTKPWNAHRNFTLSTSGLFYGWVCTLEEEKHFYDNLGTPAFTDPKKVPTPDPSIR